MTNLHIDSLISPLRQGLTRGLGCCDPALKPNHCSTLRPEYESRHQPQFEPLPPQQSGAFGTHDTWAGPKHLCWAWGPLVYAQDVAATVKAVIVVVLSDGA